MAREMRDSGVAWLGAIPVNWKFDRVKHYYTTHKFVVGESADKYERLALTLNGVIKRPKEDRTGLQPDAFNGYQVLKRGELVFKLIDLENVSTSRVGFSPYTGIVSPAYIVLKPNRTVNPRFGYYYFISLWQREIFNHLGDDGVRSSLNANDLLNLPYLFPLLDDQNQIVVYLDRKCSEIDAVLKKTRDSIEEYKKLKQAIITQAVTKGIRGDRPMKESGIEWVPMIPEDWSNYRGKHLFYETNERSETGSEELLTVSHKTGITPRSQKNVNMFMSESLVGYKICREGDIAANTMWMWQGAIGVSAYYGVISPSYNTYRQRNGAFDPQYLDYLLRIPPLVDQYNVCSTGITASRLRLYPEQFLSLRFIVPPMEEQQEIVMFLRSRVNDIDVLIQKKEQFLAELETYKKSLIYEYVTGKKEVQQKQQVKEVVVYPFFPAVFQATNPRFAQAILMSKVLDSCKVKMGRVKLEKMMFVLENSIGFDFDTEYMREAAGPLDKSVYECEQIIGRRNKWFTIRKSQYGVSYKPTSEYSKYKKYYAQYFSDYEDAINKVISIFNDFDADQAEVIATLYGAWNDCIIDKRSYTDNDIVDEVLNHWHPKKRRFPKDMWLRAIQRMRELDLVPHGYGRHTIIKQN